MSKSIHLLSADEVREELEQFQTQHDFIRPTRSNIDPTRPWINGAPNYDKADLLFFRGKTGNHSEGSLESIVENAVKVWEMEATHLPFENWESPDHASYRVSANGGKMFVGEEAALAGNYNWLMACCDKDLYDDTKETFESSHTLFRGAFLGGFPWEVLHVFSGPPKVAFTWRHWAKFEGIYREREGDGKRYEMYGFGVLDLTSDLKIKEIEIYYKPDEFLKALNGSISVDELHKGRSVIGSGCPFVHSNRKE